MQLENYLLQLQTAFAAELASVVLYGSAAAGDFIKDRSDYNVLIVLRSLGLSELQRLEAASRSWIKEGNPPPLCFTAEGLRNSADVFPIELLDMKENHRLLRGEDILRGIEVSRTNLRHQLEYELKSKLIALRERYLVCAVDPKQVRASMVESLSNFLVLFRGMLRLYESKVPAHKLDATRALAARLDFSPDVFDLVHEMKSGQKKIPDNEVAPLFGRYLKTIETVVDKVDHHLRSGNQL